MIVAAKPRRDPVVRVRLRRVSSTAIDLGGRPLTEPTAAAQPWGLELVFMPLKRPCRLGRAPAGMDGFLTFESDLIIQALALGN